MKVYTAQRFAQAKAINRAAGKPIVRYSPDFDAFVDWDFDGETLDEQIGEVNALLENGLSNGDLTAWDESH